jgi:predicted component of type VI protein secretion system
MATGCLGTPDYKGPGGGRKVILWGNGVFWEDWEEEFGNPCCLITMERNTAFSRFLVSIPRRGTFPLSAVMVVRFHVVAPVEKKRTFTVRLPILLGRSEEAKFRIQHDLVSRRHCELFESQGRVYVRDLGSTNGTFLNDEQVPASTKTVVLSGGIVRVGGLSFAVEYQTQETADATAALEPPGHADGPRADESRVAANGESLMEDQPDFQIVHQDEVVHQDEGGRQDETVHEDAAAHPEEVAHQNEESPGAPLEVALPADAPQWPVPDAAAEDVSDDEQLNNFFKGLT